MNNPTNPNLLRLLEGNRRFVAGQPQHPNQSQAHRMTMLDRQRPFAAIVGCTDSRVPPELLFDQGFGDLYVARCAGTTVDDLTIASLEVGVVAFGIEYIFVMGHSGCGAIQVTIQGDATFGHLPQLAEIIQPAVAAAVAMPGDLLVNTIQVNARRMAARLVDRSTVLSEAVAAGKIEIAAGYYDMATGVVDLLT